MLIDEGLKHPHEKYTRQIAGKNPPLTHIGIETEKNRREKVTELFPKF